jgi:hypothetical protein
MAMLPKYLQACVEVDEFDPEYSCVKGTVKCHCGSQVFVPLFPGATLKIDGRPCPCAVETDEASFFLIKARCPECQREYLLFDQDYHGWDGFRCHFPGHGLLPRPALKAWECLSCANKRHGIQLKIDLVSRDIYEEELRVSNEPFDEEKWLLSFEWIWMAITCCECGLVTKNWVDYETA